MSSSAVDVTVLEDTPDRVVLQYFLGDFTENTVWIDGSPYSQIRLGKEAQILRAGAPDLPNVCRSVIIGDADSVDVKVVAAEYYEVEADVAPSKGNLSRRVDPADVPYTFGEVYKLDADYPGELATLGAPYTLRDCHGVVVRVNPLQYNPVTRRLHVYTEMTVEVIKSSAALGAVPAGPGYEKQLSLAFHQLYQHHFVNYGSRVRYDPLDEVGEMLVICYDAWMPNMQPFVDHKNSAGIATTMVGVSTIGNDATSIKSYIQGVYDASDLAFVLLVGDATEVKSPQFTVGYETESADPMYALLDGSDEYPEIFVGRFSAQNSAQVDTQVERTIEYELMPATQQDWFKKGIGIGSSEGAGIGDDGESDTEHIENIRLDLEAYGYTHVDGFYGYSGTASQVTNAVNDGRGIINYCGHGSVYSWGTTGFGTSNINALVNDNMLPFIVSVACNNGTFDGYTCFAEAWLRATNGSEPTGAIAVYASSVSQHWAPPMAAQDETVDLLCAEAYFSFGALCFAGSCQMMDEYGYSGIEMFNTWHIFGDPSVRVYGTPVPPTGLKVAGDDLVASGQRGGPFMPDSAIYTLENRNETPIDYEVTPSVNWVDIANASGTLPGLGTVEVTVSLNAQADTLEHGLHEGVIDFVNTTDHDGDTQRPVSVIVDALQTRYSFPLDSDPGWSTEGEWAFGQPTGGGSHDGDPNAGHTGANVYGYNLLGDYTSDMPLYQLTTTSIDCTNLTMAQLRFWRWLGVESSGFDHASVEVSNDGISWAQLWANPGTSVSDSSWNQMTLDISAVADGQPTVYIRWTIGPTDSSVTYPGWNIDDVEIWGIFEDEPIPGDLDDDGDVDISDLSALLAIYGLCQGDAGFDPAADLNGSSCIDLPDLSELLAHYGMGT